MMDNPSKYLWTTEVKILKNWFSNYNPWFLESQNWFLAFMGIFTPVLTRIS